MAICGQCMWPAFFRSVAILTVGMYYAIVKLRAGGNSSKGNLPTDKLKIFEDISGVLMIYYKRRFCCQKMNHYRLKFFSF